RRRSAESLREQYGAHHGAAREHDAGAQHDAPAHGDHQPGRRGERLRGARRGLLGRAAAGHAMNADPAPAAVSRDFLDYQYRLLGIGQHMDSSDVTEICINRPGELYLETRDGWCRNDVPTLTFERARQFCTAVVNESNTGQRITDADPMVSLTFPSG